jgi:nitronate monooxygenase
LPLDDRPLSEPPLAAAVALVEPRFEGDGFEAKCSLLAEVAPAVVSFTFGCPEEALVVQGAEAGGHRGSFVDRVERVEYGLLAAAAGAR